MKALVREKPGAKLTDGDIRCLKRIGNDGRSIGPPEGFCGFFGENALGV